MARRDFWRVNRMGEKVMYAKKLLVGGLALGFGAVAVGQEYFDFGQISGLPVRPAVQVELNPSLLGFFREAARTADPATAEVLAGIDGVQVRVYNAIENSDDLIQYLDDASERFLRDDWQQIVQVQEDGDVRVFMQGTEQLITGVVAMAVNDGKAVFVSVAGSITPEQLGQLMARVDDGEFLDSLNQLSLPRPPPQPQP
jgi:hypothetical protein